MLGTVLFPNLFPQYYGAIENQELIIVVVVAYLVPFILYWIGFFTKKLSKWSMWSLTTIVSLVAALFATATKIYDIQYFNFLMTILVWLAVGYLTYGCLTIVEQIYVHALRLQTVVKYDDDYFLNQSSAHDELLKKIDAEKIRYGMYLTYFIKGYDTLENKISNVVREKITTEFAHDSYEILSHEFNEALFFKPNYKTYAMFVPIDSFEKVTSEEEKRLFARKVEDCLTEIKKQFIFKDFKISIKVNSYVSIYGINSNNLEHLFELNHTANLKKLNHSDETVYFVDPFEVLNEKIKAKNF
ncbi:hypothetical protein [Spiroplasma clarkii]|uniref:hypothetical protein n=1 Tax=Spiroplasma clarkii TaxID=2139 RepID=UPI0011BA8797|nr:hypothetical protein [Spiroplasma clarkii]